MEFLPERPGEEASGSWDDIGLPVAPLAESLVLLSPDKGSLQDMDLSGVVTLTPIKIRMLPEILGGLPHYLPGILLSRKPPETQGNTVGI